MTLFSSAQTAFPFSRASSIVSQSPTEVCDTRHILRVACVTIDAGESVHARRNSYSWQKLECRFLCPIALRFEGREVVDMNTD